MFAVKKMLHQSVSGLLLQAKLFNAQGGRTLRHIHVEAFNRNRVKAYRLKFKTDICSISVVMNINF